MRKEEINEKAEEEETERKSLVQTAMGIKSGGIQPTP